MKYEFEVDKPTTRRILTEWMDAGKQRRKK